MKLIYCLFCIIISLPATSQSQWQQRANYNMNVDVDVLTNRFSGKQTITYINNSPDNLGKLYFYLYLNAFQPNSSMDIRSRELGKRLINGRPDWDGRIKDTLIGLKENETGWQKILSVKVNGVPQKYYYRETVLEVVLSKPLPSGSTTKIEMEYEAQIPLQIRRTGRDNGINKVRYSMSQWYPKLCEYDSHGWQVNPYIAREFYGVWGNYDVTINIDKSYKLGGTGLLKNAAEIGWGYDKAGTTLKPTQNNKRKWNFVAQNVHDFMWAADPDYKHISREISGGRMIHVIYKNPSGDSATESNWKRVADAAKDVFPFVEKSYGKYPYPQYSFIHGGDGGMEYAMGTLIAGPSIGTAFHELMHSWYQMVLGFNEIKYPWMDEGFASFAEDIVSSYYYKKPSIDYYNQQLAKDPDNSNIKRLLEILPEMHSGAYASYYNIVRLGIEEPLTTPADFYSTNAAYGAGVYSKGEIFLEQLGYITGKQMRDKILLDFYNKYKFTHPGPDDFMALAQKESGIQLDWYKEYWINSVKTIDYSIDSLWEENGVTKIRFARIGEMPMPLDIELKYSNGDTEIYNIPLDIMYGSKNIDGDLKFKIVEPWRWVAPKYTLEISRRLTDVKSVEIDPSRRMADVVRKNNKLELSW